MTTILLTPPLAAENDFLERYAWSNRLLLIFSPRLDDPRLLAQNQTLAAAAAGLAERELRIIRIFPDAPVSVDGLRQESVSAASLYRDFDLAPERFAVLLIGKDGSLKMMSGQPVESIEVFDLIDAMPMRQLEMQSRTEAAN